MPLVLPNCTPNNSAVNTPRFPGHPCGRPAGTAFASLPNREDSGQIWPDQPDEEHRTHMATKQGEKIIGIDLGTTNSVVAVMEGKEPKVIAN